MTLSLKGTYYMGLFSSTQNRKQEFAEAKKYFNHPLNKGKVKFSRKKNKEDILPHSFIKVNDVIYAVANKDVNINTGFLGQGNFSKVKLVETSNGENFAVKIEGSIPVNATLSDSPEQELAKQKQPPASISKRKQQEISIMQALEVLTGFQQRKYSDNRIKHFKGKHYRAKTYTIMPLQGKTLASIVKEHRIMDMATRLYYAIAVIDAVQFLHNKKILHNDLKPDNFTETEHGLACIDFGLSKKIPDNISGIKITVGTECHLVYSPPERLLKQGNYVSKASDAYSVGVLFKRTLALDAMFYQGLIGNKKTDKTAFEQFIKTLRNKNKFKGLDHYPADTFNLPEQRQTLPEVRNMLCEKLLQIAQKQQVSKQCKKILEQYLNIDNFDQYLTEYNLNTVTTSSDNSYSTETIISPEEQDGYYSGYQGYNQSQLEHENDQQHDFPSSQDKENINKNTNQQKPARKNIKQNK